MCVTVTQSEGTVGPGQGVTQNNQKLEASLSIRYFFPILHYSFSLLRVRKGEPEAMTRKVVGVEQK